MQQDPFLSSFSSFYNSFLSFLSCLIYVLSFSHSFSLSLSLPFCLNFPFPFSPSYLSYLFFFSQFFLPSHSFHFFLPVFSLLFFCFLFLSFLFSPFLLAMLSSFPTFLLSLSLSLSFHFSCFFLLLFFLWSSFLITYLLSFLFPSFLIPFLLSLAVQKTGKNEDHCVKLSFLLECRSCALSAPGYAHYFKAGCWSFGSFPLKGIISLKISTKAVGFGE